MSLFKYVPYPRELSRAGDTIPLKYDIFRRWLAGFYLFGWGGGRIRWRSITYYVSLEV